MEEAIRWFNYTIESELLMNQIAEASKRISALVADAKQYSQMDRAPFQVADVHELLRSTLMMFADRLSKESGKVAKAITVVKEFDQSLPEIPCYPGDLNQVWTNIIDNAIAAMRDEGGTLTIRTGREGENMARVEICDTGPGSPTTCASASSTRSSPPSRSAKAPALGWTWRGNIVVKKHRGDLRVESVPGDTRFIVLLPLEIPPAVRCMRCRNSALTPPVGDSMTDSAASKPDLGRFGSFGRGVTPQQAKEIESLGYGAVWVGGSPPAELAWVEPILEATTTLQVATGIVNIWTAAAKPVAESFHRIDKAYPGRFLLGIGVGHPEADQRVPQALRRAGRSTWTSSTSTACRPTGGWWRRWVPRVLKLSARRSAGAHPYLTTPEHTAQARELIGPSAFLAPEHKVVLTTDADKARAVGRKALDIYFNLANYRNNWKRLGFSDEEVTRPGSDRLVDAVVAYGTPDEIAARLKQHLDAGADHVPVQVLTKDENLVSALAELAGPLGLS